MKTKFDIVEKKGNSHYMSKVETFSSLTKLFYYDLPNLLSPEVELYRQQISNHSKENSMKSVNLATVMTIL